MGLLEELARLCMSGATGAAHLSGRPGGTLYLVAGLLGYATCPAVPGVGRLLTASGRISSETWDAVSGPGAAEELTGGGHLTPGELQLCVRSATIDAAYFVLGPGAGPLGFVPESRHPLDNVLGTPFPVLERELARRSSLLAEAWPDPAVDSAPLVPVSRIPHRRVTLTDVQWELVANADGRRSPLDLACRLGRSAFAVTLDARRLVAAGLLSAPPRAYPPAAPVAALLADELPRRGPMPGSPWARRDVRPAEAPSTDVLLRVRAALGKL
ncbi:ADAM 12 protein [Longispora urticae]